MTKRERAAVHGGLSNPLKMRGATSNNVDPDRTCKRRCAFCYAKKGRYSFPSVQAAMRRRTELLFEAMQSDESMGRWVAAMVADMNKPRHRWHDAGDVTCLRHAYMIIWVARCTPGVKHYCPSKRMDIWREAKRLWGIPDNLVVRSSLQPGETVDEGLGRTLWSHFGCIDSDGPTDVSCPVGKGTEACEDYECFACWDPDVRSVDYHMH